MKTQQHINEYFDRGRLILPVGLTMRLPLLPYSVPRRLLFSALLPLLFYMVLLLPSCMDDDAWYEMNDLKVKVDTSLNNAISRQTGVFVLNEGNFMYDNASLSYYLIDSMKYLNDVFYRTNGTPLGDVAQSMVIRDSLGYIVVNNSSKIYVININTFEYVGKITGLTSPRYMHFVNKNKAYVSDLYAGAIAIVDPAAMEVKGYIDVRNPASPFNQHATEQFVQLGNRVFTNCWSYDNTILVINADTDQVTDSIQVPLQPNSMVADRFGKLWVLCDGGFEGNPAGHELPALVRIDPDLMEIKATFTFNLNDQPTELQVNGTGDTLYFLNRHLYRHIVTSDAPPVKVLESSYSKSASRTTSAPVVGGFYGLGIDPYSGDIYLGDAIDQVQRGVVYRYNANITVIDTFRTGINPGFFSFRPEQ